MFKLTISIIAALSENRVVGKNNKLPWHIPEDLKRFKKLTLGHPVIMGRKTFESIGRPLPNRTNIIITRGPNYEVEGAIVVHTLEEAIEQAKKFTNWNHDRPIPPLNLRGGKAFGSEAAQARRGELQNEIFVIGGAQIFAQALPLADKLYLTIVRGDFDGDAFFPDYSAFDKIISSEDSSDANHKYTFLTLERGKF